MDSLKFQLLSEKLVIPSSPTPHHLRHYNLCFLDQLECPNFVPMTLFYPKRKNTREKKSSSSSYINLEKSLSDLLSMYYPFAGRIVDNKAIDCNDKGAILSEARIMSPMAEVLKLSFSTVQRLVFPNDIPWSEAKMEVSSLAIARLTHFDCGGKALSLCLCHKLGDGNTLCNFLHHWSALARGQSFSSPQLIGSSLLPPNDDKFTQQLSQVKHQPHVARRFRFDVSNLDHLMALVASQCNVKNPTKTEIVTAFLNTSLARVHNKKTTSFTPFVTSISLNFRKLISPELTNLMGNFICPILIHIKNEDDLKLPTLVSKIRTEKIRLFKKFKRLRKDCIPTVVRSEMESFPTDIPDLRTVTSLCDYPLYDIDFGWGKPSKVSFGALPNRNSFGLFDAPDNGGVEAIAVLDEKIMKEFLRDEEILKYATLDPSF
ncbi:hypothetical protein Leryth_020998 [Lithospermum erythrorhizon]|nr:hypothetical protein Leryth_020998 [Lithospermum erythrorhizon]